jgi:hypothetical protein
MMDLENEGGDEDVKRTFISFHLVREETEEEMREDH